MIEVEAEMMVKAGEHPNVSKLLGLCAENGTKNSL